jgi:peroxiredoxin
MNKLFLFLLLPISALAQTSSKPFSISGELKLNKQVDWVYLRYFSGDEMKMDSTQPKNGSFQFAGKLAEPTTASLAVKYAPQSGEERAGREGIQLFLEPSAMKFFAKDSLKANSVTGSSAHLDFMKLNEALKPFNDRITPLFAEYSNYQKKGDEANMKKVEDAITTIQKVRDEEVYVSFIKANPQSPVALYALRQYAGWDINPDKIEPMLAALPESIRQAPSALALKEQVEIAKKTAVGKMAMDFTQNDTLGRPVSLSSFRGKYVLIDFWASWCGPCRKENPNVVKAFQKYKDKNFTVLGVSLDRSNAHDKWMKAIHDDGLTWNHVSDLKFWDNEVAKLYGIKAIPQNLLLDPQGKIVAKNINGEELHSKLESLLK